VIRVVPSASAKNIWMTKEGGGSCCPGVPGRVTKTKVEGCRVVLRVVRRVVRLVSPRAAILK